jgi:hypothetical protein
LLSFFPAVDTITDLVYILSQDFFNYALFIASVLCITSQFWVFVVRLKRRRVFEAFSKRTVELAFLKTLSWWPKWASPDSLPVFFALILPFYILFYVVFPVVWFFVGYVIYSFQLFPISRISNRWLYMFVYSFKAENDSYRRRFDTCDAIILPMVQKGKVEETILESVPQLVIQLVNSFLLGKTAKMQGFAIFCITFSALSILSTLWYCAYWNLFRCKPIRDRPSSLSLYNYKLSGVKEGAFSFGKLCHVVSDVNEIEMAEQDNMLSVTITDTVLNDKSGTATNDPDKQIDCLPKKTHAEGGSEIEVVRPHNTELDELRKAEEEIKVILQELRALEAEKLRTAEELRQLNLAAAATAAKGTVLDPLLPLDTVDLAICHRSHLLIFGQVQHAAVKLQCVVRGHFGRCLFRARCVLVTHEIMQEGSSDTIYLGSLAMP